VARKELAGRGDSDQLSGAEKGQDQIDQFGWETREAAPFERRIRGKYI